LRAQRTVPCATCATENRPPVLLLACTQNRPLCYRRLKERKGRGNNSPRPLACVHREPSPVLVEPSPVLPCVTENRPLCYVLCTENRPLCYWVQRTVPCATGLKERKGRGNNSPRPLACVHTEPSPVLQNRPLCYMLLLLCVLCAIN